jgi:hypothetical protein
MSDSDEQILFATIYNHIDRGKLELTDDDMPMYDNEMLAKIILRDIKKNYWNYADEPEKMYESIENKLREVKISKFAAKKMAQHITDAIMGDSIESSMYMSKMKKPSIKLDGVYDIKPHIELDTYKLKFKSKYTDIPVTKLSAEDERTFHEEGETMIMKTASPFVVDPLESVSELRMYDSKQIKIPVKGVPKPVRKMDSEYEIDMNTVGDM